MNKKIIALAIVALSPFYQVAVAQEEGTSHGSSTAAHTTLRTQNQSGPTAPGVNNTATQGTPEQNDALPSASVVMTGKIEQDRKRGMRNRDHDYDSDNN